MEPFQIVLIIVLVVCVLALFFIYYKKKRDDEEAAYRSGSSSGGSAAPVGPRGSLLEPKPEPVKPVSVQHTLYVFERYQQVRQCPRCDGENSVNRNICCICGFDFTKGVR